MSGYLGYRPDLLHELARSMRSAASELAAIRSDDPEAAAAITTVRRMERTLTDTWLPVVQQILSCTALTAGFAPVRLDGDDVRSSLQYVMQGYGWQVVTDPAPAPAGPPVVSAMEARAIAVLLSRSGITELLDSPEELRWVRDRVALVAADAGLSIEFRRNLDAPWVLASLADEHLHAANHGAGAASRARAALLDALLRSCTRISAGEDRGAWMGALVDELDPYEAALVLRALELDGERLGDLAARIMVRWAEPPDDHGSWDDTGGPTRTADILFPLLAADPHAAARFLMGIGPRPAIVLASTDDGPLVQRVLLAGTDPAVASPAAAGAFIVPMVRWVQREQLWIHHGSIGGGFVAHELIGAVAAPWLLQFGPRASEWGWTHDDADAALRFVIDDPTSLAAILHQVGRWQDGITGRRPVDGGGRVDVGWLSDTTSMLDQLQRAFETEHIEDAAARRFLVDVAITWISFAITEALGKTRFAVAGEVAPDLIAGLDERLTRAGYLPPDADMASELARAERVERVRTMAVIAVVGAATQLVAVGALPAGALDHLALDVAGEECDLRTTRDRLEDFVEGLREHCGPAEYNAMVAILASFLPEQTVNELC